MKTHPAIGWVRANRLPSEQVESELLELQRQNQKLQKELESIRGVSNLNIEELAQGDEEVELTYSFELQENNSSTKVTISESLTTDWDTLYSFIAPSFLEPLKDERLRSILSKFLVKMVDKKIRDEHGPTCKPSGMRMDEESFSTVKIQFRALGLIYQTDSGWQLTKKGDLKLLQTRSVKRSGLVGRRVKDD